MSGQEKFPEVCGWFGARRIAMRGAMAEVKRLEGCGIPVTNKKFGRILSGEWDKVKDQQGKICPVD